MYAGDDALNHSEAEAKPPLERRVADYWSDLLKWSPEEAPIPFKVDPHTVQVKVNEEFQVENSSKPLVLDVHIWMDEEGGLQVHLLIDCRETLVSKSDVQRFLKVKDDLVTAGQTGLLGWRVPFAFQAWIVSSTGFDDDAISLAKEHQIGCIVED